MSKKERTTYPVGPLSYSRMVEAVNEAWRDAGREALREELGGLLSISHAFKVDVPYCEVDSLHVYDGKLYASVGPAGEFWEFDGATWTLVHRFPYTAGYGAEEFVNWRGTTWAHEVFSKDNCLYFGGFGNPQPPWGAVIVRFDGETWQDIVLNLGAYEEVFCLAEFRGKLYAGNMTGRIFESTNGLAWIQIYTKTDNMGAAGMAVYKNRLWVGSCGGGDPHFYATGNGRIYWFDGTTWGYVTLPDATESVNSIIARGDYMFVSCHSGRIYVGDPTVPSWSVLVKLGPSDEVRLMGGAFDAPNAIYVLRGSWHKRGSTGDAWYFEVKRYHSLWGGIFRPLLSGPMFVSMENYEGRMYFGSAWSHAPHNYIRSPTDYWASQAYIHAITLSELERISMEPKPQLSLDLWTARAVGVGGDTTDPVPAATCERKTFYLISDQAGTLTIEVDPVGNGDWRTFDTVTVTANVLAKIMTNYDFARARMNFVPAVAATVSAWVVFD